jgi:ribosomal-protein-alanine N-acetyltransferase
MDAWHLLLSNPKTMYYLQDIMAHSLEESRENLEIAVAEAQNPNRAKYFFAIEDKATGVFIGTVGYTVARTTPAGKVVGAGYFILPKYHGGGIMTEALSEVIRFAFEDGGVYRIETGCLAENRASERVMQKCGLIKESERKAHTWHDGRLKDRVEYRLLRNEWQSSSEMFKIEPVADGHRAFVDAQIAESWAGPYIAVHGVLFDSRTHPGFVAVEDGAVVGYILYNIADGDCEITVLESLRMGKGIGHALINAVIGKAREADCRRVWLVTTNDNTHAIRFYQRFGFGLRAVRIGALEESRKLKPQIPLIGDDGIRLQHEFEFEIILKRGMAEGGAL